MDPAVTGAVIGDDGLARPPWAAVDPMLREYYDTEWGLPVRDEQGLYERISLEAFQAGLSWATILAEAAGVPRRLPRFPSRHGGRVTRTRMLSVSSSTPASSATGSRSGLPSPTPRPPLR